MCLKQSEESEVHRSSQVHTAKNDTAGGCPNCYLRELNSNCKRLPRSHRGLAGAQVHALRQPPLARLRAPCTYPRNPTTLKAGEKVSQTLFLIQKVSDTVFLVSGTLILAQRVSGTLFLRPSTLSKHGRWVAELGSTHSPALHAWLPLAAGVQSILSVRWVGTT